MRFSNHMTQMSAELLAHFDKGDSFIYFPFLESRVVLVISSLRAKLVFSGECDAIDLDKRITHANTHAHTIHTSEYLWIRCFENTSGSTKPLFKISSKVSPSKKKEEIARNLFVGPFRIYNPTAKSSDVCKCRDF